MVWMNMLSHEGLVQHQDRDDSKKWHIGPLKEMTTSELGDCNIMLEATTDAMCFLPGGNVLKTGMLDEHDQKIRDKWEHCLACGGCTVRYSMVQMMKEIRPIDMKVIIMEFVRAIGVTGQLTQVGEVDSNNPFGTKKKSLDTFIRTCFGVLQHRLRAAKQGYTFAIDFNEIDERTREGATIMAELIGMQAFMMGGKGASRVTKVDNVGKRGRNVRTFRYNSSAITVKGKI